jgi:hypothetical protein
MDPTCPSGLAGVLSKNCKVPTKGSQIFQEEAAFLFLLFFLSFIHTALGWLRKYNILETAGSRGRLLTVFLFLRFTNTKTNNQPSKKARTRQERRRKDTQDKPEQHASASSERSQQLRTKDYLVASSKQYALAPFLKMDNSAQT